MVVFCGTFSTNSESSTYLKSGKIREQPKTIERKLTYLVEFHCDVKSVQVHEALLKFACNESHNPVLSLRSVREPNDVHVLSE